jgi:hypothetical protein
MKFYLALVSLRFNQFAWRLWMLSERWNQECIDRWLFNNR